MLTNERKEQIVEVLQNLIQRRSYSGEEKEVAEYIKKLCLDCTCRQVWKRYWFCKRKI